MEQLNTPVLLLMYNRPDLAMNVFYQIRKVKPKKLYISIDGPKDENDLININICREIESLIDWPCEIHKYFRDSNEGCKRAVTSGINWFFTNEESGIILEDDCLPDVTFFTYCEELLKYYENDLSVGHISGVNFLNTNDVEESYYFSNYSYSWGWATWKRAWELFDVDMLELPSIINNKLYSNINLSFKEKAYWNNRLIKTYLNKIDTWDYQWLYTLWANNLKSIVPTRNLISNIGFDHRATHTKGFDETLSNKETQSIPFIIHPNNQEKISVNDTKSFENVINFGIIKAMVSFAKTLLFTFLINKSKKKKTWSPKTKMTWAFRMF